MKALLTTFTLVALFVTGPAAFAQQPPMSEVEPIRCWWQSSAGAVTIGEAFTVSLTCAVLETESVQVVPDESRLGVASIQMAPFEILGGDHPPDSRTGSRRFFQYHYTIRTLDRDMIGHDVKIQQLALSYRVHSRVGADAALEGRDLTYLLPPIPLRVLSLVPAEAPDIRDGGDASLGAVDALRFRASLFRILGVTFAIIALMVAVLALMPLAKGAAQVAADDHTRLPERLVLNRVEKELTEVQTASAKDGWSDALVMRGLSALRLAAAHAIGKEASQKVVPPGAKTPEGRLLVQRGWPRALQVAASSSVTADDVDRAVAALPDTASETTRQQLAELGSALRAFTIAVYPKVPVRDVLMLDEAVTHALTLARQRGKG